MPRNPKIFFNNSVHFVTTSVEDGLMFPPNPLINEIMVRCLAHAQSLHPVTICDILIEPTHVHLILQVIDPQDAADFMERFKCESAHAVNRLLGRKKKTVWCEGYDSPLIEDAQTLIDRIAYIYENPAKDNLEESVRDFPGLNTFALREALAEGEEFTEKEFQTALFARSDIKPLPKGKKLTQLDFMRIRRQLIKDKPPIAFTVSPNAWMKRFGILSKEDQQRSNQQIVAELTTREEKHQKRRNSEGKRVLGASKLKNTPVGAPYIPERTGYKMLTHSLDKATRIRTITWMRELIQKGKTVLEKWRSGDFSVRYPLGLFPPTGIRIAEPIGW